MESRYLFFHYGPGGNAQIEKKWLGRRFPQIEFWDQPHFSHYESLVQACVQKASDFAADSSIGLIGHSFGADLALSVAERLPNQVSKLILISPLRETALAFLNLGTQLNKLGPSQDLKTALEALTKVLNTESATLEEKLEATWGVIGFAATHPAFTKVYWADRKMFEKFLELDRETQSLNFEVWQQVLREFFLLKKKPSLQPQKFPTHVILGAHDPYYDIAAELEHYEKILPKDSVSLVDKAGHHPHLETDALEKLLNGSIA